MKIMAITQARYGSSRFLGKVLKPLGTSTVLDLHLRRIKKTRLINAFAVATTQEPESNEISLIAKDNGFDVFKGSLHDVLDRYYQAARIQNPDFVVRVTSDCPLIDPNYLDELVEKFLAGEYDYGSNCLRPTLPDGMDAEIFSFSALEEAWLLAKKNSEREHVTPFIRESSKFRKFSLEYPLDRSSYRLTLDTQEDYQVIKKLVENCGAEAKMEDYVHYLDTHPDLKSINHHFQRNEGYKISLENDEVDE